MGAVPPVRSPSRRAADRSRAARPRPGRARGPSR